MEEEEEEEKTEWTHQATKRWGIMTMYEDATRKKAAFMLGTYISMVLVSVILLLL